LGTKRKGKRVSENQVSATKRGPKFRLQKKRWAVGLWFAGAVDEKGKARSLARKNPARKLVGGSSGEVVDTRIQRAKLLGGLAPG